MVGRRRIQHGFSLVEIIIGLTIMSVLVGITVTTYSDSAQRAREQVAQDEARAIASSIQRWQLENQRPYPFRNVLPLVPRFLKNVSSDPWTSQYKVDTTQKIVYSFGPDGQDDAGAGDDVSYFYDTSGDVAPGPPQGLVVRREGSNIRITFQAPVRNADGSKPVDDLSRYEIFIRSSKETTVRKFFDVDPASSLSPSGETTPDSSITSIYGAGALDELYYFTVRAIDEAGNISGPSNQAGLFVSKEVDPRIVLFKPSSTTPPVSSAFSFFIEVIDADSNLAKIEIRDFLKSGAPVVFTTADEISNPFRFVKNWAPSTSEMTPRTLDSPRVSLYVEDEQLNTVTTEAPRITFTNRAPLITALTPGIKLLTRNPLHPTGQEEVTFTMEAADQEANMNNLHLELVRTSPTPSNLETRDFPLNPKGAVMIRTWSYSFDVLSVGEYELRVYAEDDLGEQSLQRTARIIVKNDTTPPDAMVVSLDPSNPLQRDSEYAGTWWSPTATSIRVYMEAFEIESPPVTYQIKITDEPFGPNWEDPGLDTWPDSSVNGDDGTSAAAGWYDVTFPYAYPPQDYLLEKPNALGIQYDFDETKFYSLGMRASNAVGLVNITTAEPIHLSSLTPQNPFRVDKTPPNICPTCIEILGTKVGSVVWLQDQLSAEWDVTDWVQNTQALGAASGDNLYRYRIWRRDSSGTTRESTPLYDWTEVLSKQINSIALPNLLASDNGRFIELEVVARDLAGNWMTAPQTALAQIDFTRPEIVGIPRITNLVGGVVPVLDTLSADWGPELSVLQDLQSGIESYEWGISTTSFVDINAVPDVFGWIPVVGSSFTSGTISLNNLLTEGDTVHAVVRARNFAGAVSETVPSTGALVSVSLRTEFDATPRTGLSPLRVNFSGEVIGGDPPFDFRFQFDGTSLKEFAVLGTTETKITTSFLYDLSDASLPRPEILARLIIEDDAGRKSQKDVIIDLRDDLVAGVSYDNKEALLFFSINGAGAITDLFSAQDPDINGASNNVGFGQMFLEPNGQFLVGIPATTAGTAGDDQVIHAILDDPSPGTSHIDFNTIKGVDLENGPEISTMSFTPNVPRGTLVQTFRQNLASDGISCAADGMIRAMTIDRVPTEVVGTFTEFGCDDSAVPVDMQYFGGVADPLDVSVGMGLYKGPPPFASTDFFGKRFDGVNSFPDMITGFSDPSLPQTTNISFNGYTLGAPPAAVPSIRVWPAASPLGYVLIANNQPGSPNNRIIRIATNSDGFGEMDALTPETPGNGLAPGNLDLTADGRVFATLLSPAGDGASWSVGVGYVTSPTWSLGVGGAGIARNIDIDDGGTRVAVPSSNGNVYIYKVEDLDTDPRAVSTGAVTVNAASRISTLSNGTAVGLGGTPSAVRFFRRPNSGQPQITGVFDPLDDGGAGDNNTNALDGSLDVDDDTAQLIVKGVNLDKVQNGTISLSLGTSCSGMNPDRTSLPPLAPYGAYTTYVPPQGDAYHYMRVIVDQPCFTNLGSGPLKVQMRIETPLGTSKSVTTTSFTTIFD